MRIYKPLIHKDNSIKKSTILYYYEMYIIVNVLWLKNNITHSAIFVNLERARVCESEIWRVCGALARSRLHILIKRARVHF